MKLKFLKDTFYNDELFAKAGEIKEVSEELGFAARWIKRGALVVSEECEAKLAEGSEVAPSAEEVKKEDVVEAEKALDNKQGKKIKGIRVG